MFLRVNVLQALFFRLLTDFSKTLLIGLCVVVVCWEDGRKGVINLPESLDEK